jgi:hypothetical protein
VARIANGASGDNRARSERVVAFKIGIDMLRRSY